MHPFWAVRRLTAGQLNSEPASRKGGSFNCELIEKSFSVVCVGSCKDTLVSCTFEVTLPMLTNLVSVKKMRSCCWRSRQKQRLQNARRLGRTTCKSQRKRRRNRLLWKRKGQSVKWMAFSISEDASICTAVAVSRVASDVSRSCVKRRRPIRSRGLYAIVVI